MKTTAPFIFLCFALFSCNNQHKTTAATADSLKFPFKAQYSINWQPGDEKNALLVLNCLKKYVAGDIKGCTAYFADTSEFSPLLELSPTTWTVFDAGIREAALSAILTYRYLLVTTPTRA